MSVPYKIQAMEELLEAKKEQPKASDRIPMIARPFVSDRAKECLDIVRDPTQPCKSEAWPNNALSY